LKLVQLIGSGYDGLNLDAARKAGVPIATNGGANSVAVAEHTLLLMLAVQRRLAWQHNNVVAGRWRVGNHAEHRLHELAGKQLGLIGFGAIGREVAKRARAFDMSIIYYARRRLTEDDEARLGVNYLSLEGILASSDIVSIHVPLTSDTRGLIGPSQLALMKGGAILINTSRGGVVQQDALVAALRDSKIAGVGLDVLEHEPPNVDDPLLKFDTAILTPHTAGPTWENWYKSFQNSFENVRRVAAGKMPLWIVPELDPSRPVG
jgi:phosphoglycerate dehydrogenase-like enzyme